MTSPGWLRDPRYDAGLSRLEQLQAQESRLYADRAREFAALSAWTSRDGWQGEAPWDSLLLDVAGTCRLGQVAAGSRLLESEHLVGRLPQTLDALDQGWLRVQQAQVLVAETKEQGLEVCAGVEERVLPVAGPLPPADLRRLVRRVVLELDAGAQAEREEQARTERRVGRKALPDGMALLWAVLPAEQAEAAWAQLTAQARAARAGGEGRDGRTTDQLRADLLAQHLAGSCAPAGPVPWVRPVVQVPLAVAAGASDAAAELEGYGPISAAHARRLLSGAALTRACVDPETGEVWAVDRPAPGTGRGSADRRRPRGAGPLHTVAPAPAAAAPGLPPPWRPPAEAVPAEAVPAKTVPAKTGSVTPVPVPVPPLPVTSPTAELRAALQALLALPLPAPREPEPRHDPSRPLARLVRARDGRCDGIGCSVPASRCELDHDIAWPDGDTSPANVVARSQRCHHAKHHGWTPVRTRTATWWTSPGGRTYEVPLRGRRPPPAVDAATLRELLQGERATAGGGR